MCQSSHHLRTILATKTTLNAKINGAKGEIPDITNLTTSSSLNAKTDEAKGEILNITNLVTTSSLTVVENEIPIANNVVKKN